MKPHLKFRGFSDEKSVIAIDVIPYVRVRCAKFAPIVKEILLNYV